MICRIRKWELSDAKDLAAILSNPKIQDNLRDGLPYPYTEQDGMDFISTMRSAGENETFAFAITANEKVIGSIGVFRQGNIHRLTAEMGYCIAEEYWGKGLMTEAVIQTCKYVFGKSDIIRIYAEPFAYNTASCRVLEKAGFQYEGTLRNNAVKNGKVIDMKMYSLLKQNVEIIKIREHKEIIPKACEWFASKWKVPVQAYEESMLECLKNEASVPQWYVLVENDAIIGGMGVIANDFHNRKDLTPNVCAVYVEKEHRRKGLAGKLLKYVCDDMADFGIKTLYLLTDHTAFYERYGWEFLCMVQGDGESYMSRMYIHRQ